jgi:formylglycine-generating enzyme required for sulfatase activity
MNRLLIAAATISLLLSAPSRAADPAPLKPGDTFRDCDVCPEMVVVPAGDFRMGSEKGKEREQPLRDITIPRPFAISKYEITYAEWDACMAAGGCDFDPDDHKWGRGRMPIINVTWDHARMYLSWLSTLTGHVYRMPTEAEWEYAARAGTTTEYWWGDTYKDGYANCRKCGTEWSGKQSAPVGSFPPNPWGLHDMHGNAWEWTVDCWNETLEGVPADGTARLAGSCDFRVVRSGSWYYFKQISRSAYRDKFASKLASYNISIRALRELP